jgi:hypothetical protein
VEYREPEPEFSSSPIEEVKSPESDDIVEIKALESTEAK